MILYIKSFFLKKTTRVYIKIFTILLFLFILFISVRQYYLDLQDNYYKSKAYIEVIAENNIPIQLETNNAKIQLGAVLQFNSETDRGVNEITDYNFGSMKNKNNIYIFERNDLKDNEIIIPYQYSKEKYFNKINSTFIATNPINNKNFVFQIKDYEQSDFYFYYVSPTIFKEITKENYLKYWYINNLTHSELTDSYFLLKEKYVNEIEYLELITLNMPPFQFLQYYNISLIGISILLFILSCIIIKNLLNDFDYNDKLYKIIGYSYSKIYLYRFISCQLAIIISLLQALLFLFVIIVMMHFLKLLPLHFIKFEYLLIIIITTIILTLLLNHQTKKFKKQ